MKNTSKRIRYLTQYHGCHLLARYFSNPNKGRSLKRLMTEKLARYDPTDNGSYTQWIMVRYLRGDFEIHEEDKLNDIRTLLEQFHRIKHRIKPSDINSYDINRLKLTLSRLSMTSTTSRKERIKTYRQHLYQSGQVKDIWQGDPGYSIKQLNSREAAVFFGRGTKWCISGREHNRFCDYNQHGNLLCLSGNGRKLLFCIYTGELVNEKNEALYLQNAEGYCADNIQGDEPWRLIEAVLIWHMCLAGYPINGALCDGHQSDRSTDTVKGLLNDYEVPPIESLSSHRFNPENAPFIKAEIALLKHLSNDPFVQKRITPCHLIRPRHEIEHVIKQNPSAINFIKPVDEKHFMEMVLWQPELLRYRIPLDRRFLKYCIEYRPSIVKRLPYTDGDLLEFAAQAENNWHHHQEQMETKYGCPVDAIADYCDMSPKGPQLPAHLSSTENLH